MRVLISSDHIGCLGPAEASDMVAAAFAERGAQVAVTPMAAGGPEFVAAAARFAPQAHISVVHDLDQLLPAASRHEAFLDATALATPTWEELTGLPSNPAPTHTLVVPESEAELTLTGLQGAIATQGRDSGQELSETLARNAVAEQWLSELGVLDCPGAGALGGLGAWALAQGMTVASGLEICRLGYRLDQVAAKTDVVVTGTTELDFHRRGGPVVKLLTHVAERALVPLVVVTGRNFVSARELRLTGVEEAHALQSQGAGHLEIDATALTDLARRVAGTWTWRG